MESTSGALDDEIESWEGFPKVMRKEDREIWESMVKDLTGFGPAVEASGKVQTVEPFFISILILQQRTIERLESELEKLNEKREPPLSNP